MEAGLGSRKRKQPSPESDPFSVTSQASVIDLRARRVFSPATIADSIHFEADAVVAQMTPAITESENDKRLGNQITDTKGIMSKSQSSVRGPRKVFKTPTSFSYNRLLPYLTDSRNSPDPFSFEIVDAPLPKVMKSGPNMVASKEDGFGKTSEKQCGLISSNVDVWQKDDSLEECEQMTPPASDIYTKFKNDNMVDVLVNPKLKPALKSCSRRKILQTPTSFSHRRLLPFLMSVAEDYSCPLKSNQSVKLEKAIEENQQPLTQSLSHQDEKTTADETSNSPTSTLVPLDTSFDATKTVTLVSNDNVLDANEPDKEGSGSISQLDVNLQVEAVNSDSCIKLEQSPPKSNLKCVEEAISKATPLCIEQSYSEDCQITVKESPQQCLLQISEYNGENIKNGILKRTPRGCRGICNCLNCTSFRLHAERSFEFSKNQLHDAEEVALELINDLTSLRNILETTSSYSNSLDTLKEKQVKEACARALYKEQVARARLAQMNEDLSIHCRSMNLLRPKVTFANKIEQKVISNDEIHGKKSV